MSRVSPGKVVPRAGGHSLLVPASQESGATGRGSYSEPLGSPLCDPLCLRGLFAPEPEIRH